MPARVVLNKASLRFLFEGRDQPVQRELRRKANELLAVAKDRCPRTEGRGPHLRSYLVRRVNPKSVTVGVLGPLKMIRRMQYVQLGTRAHHIPTTVRYLENGRPAFLRFEIEGMVIYVSQERGVEHPGTQPNPFLEEAAAELGLIVREVGETDV